MARLDKLPQQWIIDGFKGTIDYYRWKGIAVARRWPRYFTRTPTPAEKTNQDDFAYINKLYRTLPPIIIDALKDHATGTTQTAKDYLVRAYLKGLLKIMPPILPDHNHTALGDGGQLSAAIIDTFLDLLEQAAAPANPPANTARLYAREHAGVTKLYYKQDDGTEVELGAAADAYPPTWKFDLDQPKTVPDTPDDEFDQGAGGLDPKWTVADGVSAAVQLLGNPTGRYDLTTRVGFLLLQARNTDNVDLRQDYTLPDTQSIVLALSFGMAIDARSGIVTDEVIVGLSLNNNDGGAHLGDYIVIEADADPDGWKIRSYFTAVGDYDSTPENQHGAPLARRIYFRVIRSGTNYWSYYSGDGTTWQSLGAGKAVGAVLDNIWIYVHTVGALSPTPIHAVNWIRQGTNAFDPW